MYHADPADKWPQALGDGRAGGEAGASVSGTCRRRLCTVLRLPIAKGRIRKMKFSSEDEALVDAGVGARIREYRRTLGMTQASLAEQIGVTFQQVQRYENGMNRVSASKLHQIAEVLDIELIELFKPLETDTSKDGRLCPSDEVVLFIKTTEGQQLNEAFADISDGLVRRKLVELVQTLAH